MRSVRRPAAGLLAVVGLCLWAAGGCGDGPTTSVDTSNTEAIVQGVVKINGALATEGEIVFDPTNYKRTDAQKRTAPIGKDGTYSVKTLTGENIVTLAGAVTKKNGALQYTKRAFLVNSGENSFDFVVGGEETPAPAK